MLNCEKLESKQFLGREREREREREKPSLLPVLCGFMSFVTTARRIPADLLFFLFQNSVHFYFFLLNFLFLFHVPWNKKLSPPQASSFYLENCQLFVFFCPGEAKSKLKESNIGTSIAANRTTTTANHTWRFILIKVVIIKNGNGNAFRCVCICECENSSGTNTKLELFFFQF